jgi:hypothetical protein
MELERKGEKKQGRHRRGKGRNRQREIINDILNTDGCFRLSSDKLQHHFKSVSELRAILLSIYPYLQL